MKPKILVFDIETAPNLVYTWGIWEQNVIKVVRPWYILCYSAKWLGEKSSVYALPDFKEYKKDPESDKEVCQKLRDLLDEADVVIAHNGDKFDVRKSNARFIKHGIQPPSPYKTIDTLKVARKYFNFDSNKLNDLGEYLGVGKKVETGGFELWDKCMKGDKKAWSLMKKYNKQDVDLLEKIYFKLRPWMATHPNMALFNEEEQVSCKKCGSFNHQKRGPVSSNSLWYQQYYCNDCGGWFRGDNSLGKSRPV